MLIYKESFPIKKGLRFSSYIKKLEEQVFTPYIMLIEKTDNPELYRFEIIATDFGNLNFHAFVDGSVLLNECYIEYSKEERKFTISASISPWNLVRPVFYIGISVCLFLVILIYTIIKKSPLENIFVVLILMLFFLIPYIAMYSNERKFLNRIGQIGTE